jgi:hypothetical protein
MHREVASRRESERYPDAQKGVNPPVFPPGPRTPVSAVPKRPGPFGRTEVAPATAAVGHGTATRSDRGVHTSRSHLQGGTT